MPLIYARYIPLFSMLIFYVIDLYSLYRTLYSMLVFYIIDLYSSYVIVK